LGRDLSWRPPAPVGPLSILGEAPDGRPVALVVFYRANLMAADIAPVTRRSWRRSTGRVWRRWPWR